MTLRSEECTSERWTTRFGSFFPFFLAAGVQRGQFATKVMLLAGIRRRAVVTPSFIEVLRPLKAGEVESVNFYKVAAVSLCRRWAVLVHKCATLWSVARLKDKKKNSNHSPLKINCRESFTRTSCNLGTLDVRLAHLTHT